MAPLLSLQSLLHVSSLENGVNHHQKQFKEIHNDSHMGRRQKQKKDKDDVDLLIQGKAIKQRKSDCLSNTEADDLVSLARMFSEEGHFQGTCLHVDEDQIAEQEVGTIRHKTIFEEQTEDDRDPDSPLDQSGVESVFESISVKQPPTDIDDLSPLQRLQKAHVFPLLDNCENDPMLSSTVSGVIESGLLVGDLDKAGDANLIDINSGGELYFVFFKSSGYFNSEVERACVVKFATNRMGTQGEALAYEIALSLGVPSPPAKIIREDTPIWEMLKKGADNLSESNMEESADGSIESEVPIGVPTLATSPNTLLHCLKNNKCALMIELVNGPPLARASDEFMKHQYASQVANSMGALFALDMILANPDRLASKAFGWRGNKNNMRWDTSALRVVGIDHTLARRPPRMLRCTAAAVEKVTSTIFSGTEDGNRVVEEALRTVFGELELSQEERESIRDQFKQGIHDTFTRSEGENGSSVLSQLKATEAFLADNLGVFFTSLRTALGVSEDCDFNSTRDLRNLQKQAAEDADVRDVFRESQKCLASVVSTYVRTCSAPGIESFMRCSDLTAVNCYELRTRLRHIIPRFESFVKAIQGISKQTECE